MPTPVPYPVTVTRIQNRRGTYSQFLNLYPVGYSGVGGFNSIPGYTAAAYPNVLQPGELALCTDNRKMFMGNLNGEYIEVGAGTGGGSTGTVSSVNVSGGSTGLAAIGGPITTSGTIVLGGKLKIENGGTNAMTAQEARTNLLPSQSGQNGKYLKTNGTDVSWQNLPAPGVFTPLIITLLPTSTSFVHIPELDYDPTPFYRIMYGITDAPASVPPILNDANNVGPLFSKNGQLELTVILPSGGEYVDAILTDLGTELQPESNFSVSFKASYNSAGNKVQISYVSNYPTPLLFTTTSLKWSSL